MKKHITYTISLPRARKVVAGIDNGVMLMSIAAVIKNGTFKNPPRIEVSAYEDGINHIWVDQPLRFNEEVCIYLSSRLGSDAPMRSIKTNSQFDFAEKEKYCRHLASELGYILKKAHGRPPTSQP